MPEGGEAKLTLSDIEEQTNEAALRYAKDHYTLPVTAFRIFLWPGSYISKIQSGPTAKIWIGVMPWQNPREFVDAMKRSIDRVACEHLYSTLAVEHVAHVLEREAGQRRWWREHYNFDPDLIPHMLHDDELSIRHVERIEVVHKATGLREVVEVEPGRARSTFAAREIAKARLARRVLETRRDDAAA